jgi:Maltokinase N-terminal cap domain
MSVIHHTTLTPSKLELLGSWLPAQPWYSGGRTPELTKAGGFRLDDPHGDVGIEFMAVTDAAGPQPVTYHVPLSYRGRPLDGADQALIGTSEHGVLGRRWVYDGAHDPVLVAQLFALIVGGTEPQAQSVSDTPDPTVTRSYALTGHTAAVGPLAVTDGPDGTDVLVRSVVVPGPRTRPASELVIRVHRLLRPGRDAASGGAAQPLGHVSAGWLQPDGAEARDFFAVVRTAASDRATR